MAVTGAWLYDGGYTIHVCNEVPIFGEMYPLVTWSDTERTILHIPSNVSPDDYVRHHIADYLGSGRWRRVTIVQIKEFIFEVGAGDFPC